MLLAGQHHVPPWNRHQTKPEQSLYVPVVFRNRLNFSEFVDAFFTPRQRICFWPKDARRARGTALRTTTQFCPTGCFRSQPQPISKRQSSEHGGKVRSGTACRVDGAVRSPETTIFGTTRRCGCGSGNCADTLAPGVWGDWSCRRTRRDWPWSGWQSRTFRKQPTRKDLR